MADRELKKSADKYSYEKMYVFTVLSVISISIESRNNP